MFVLLLTGEGWRVGSKAGGGRGKEARAAVEARTGVGRRMGREIWPTERNVEESYLFAGASNTECGLREYVVEAVLEDGSKVNRRFGYKPSSEYGDTTAFDRDVWRAITLVAQRSGGIPKDGIVHFSVYQLVNILGLPRKGDSYSRIRHSIWKLRALEVRDDYYRADRKGYKQERFSPFNHATFEGNEDRYGKASEHHYVELSKVIVRSYHEGFVREIDHALYFALKKRYARGLYSEIDVGRGDGLVWEVPLATVAEKLGMPKSYKAPSAQKRKLEAAHEELRRKGVLASVSYPDRYTVRYEVADGFVRDEGLRQREWTQEEEETVQALIAKEVYANVARKLVAEKGPAMCKFYLRALPLQKWVKDPPAFLYRYISEERPLSIEPPQRALEEAGIGEEPGEEGGVPGGAWSDKETGPEDGAKERYEEDAAAAELWAEVLVALEPDIDVSSLRVWFGGAFACGLKRSELSVVVPNSFASEYISSRFGESIDGALRERLGPKGALRILVGERA